MKKILLAVCYILVFQIVYAEISVEYFGGAERVSGSCALLKNDKTSVIIDCGTFYEEGSLPVNNKNVNPVLLNAKALVLTHAHVDHAGLIPLLISEGFGGNIYCTSATKKIVFELYDDGWNFEDIKQNYFWSKTQRIKCQQKQRGTVTLHWFDSCSNSIAKEENLKEKVSSEQLKKIYNVKFRLCKKCLNLYLKKLAKRFIEIKYGNIIELSKNLSFSLFNAGHIPGSASIVFNIADNDLQKTIIFSGDLGSGYSKLVINKEQSCKADYIFLEGTYGGSNRKIDFSDYDNFQKALAGELNKNNIVWIPALALQRTQKILYEIKKAQDKGLISSQIPIYSLSPSSNGLTKLYETEIKNPSAEKWFNEDIYSEKSLVASEYITSKPKQYPKPAIIISASGMMDKGVSFSLLGKLLSRKDVSVFLVSYAGLQTPAGKLKKGFKKIKTKYGTIEVLASVKSFDIFSDHPDINESIKWLGNDNKKTNIYLIHGEKESLESAKNILKQRGFLNSKVAPINQKIIIR
ncbi:MAG: MBL fold metallo-hydrolase [Endomicrobiaceae bacterium]|nr:MBL fold metallo-hydrolase [Endomicrobiaceae bacterium]